MHKHFKFTFLNVFLVVSLIIFSFFSLLLLPFNFSQELSKSVYDFIGDPISDVCILQGPSTRYSYNSACFVNKSILEEKINQGLPSWAKDQIQADLSKFSTITTADLDEHYYLYNTPANIMLRFKVENGQVRVIPSNIKNDVKRFYIPFNQLHKSVVHHPRVKALLHMLKYLVKNNYIGDVDFIVALQDYGNIQANKALPIFTFARDESHDNTTEKDLILIPDWLNLSSAINLRPLIHHANKFSSWENKKPIVFWRGGGYDISGFRKKLVALSNEYPQQIDARFVYEGSPEKFVSPEDHLQYKYLMSIDGLRASWERLIWHLHSNSLVFKHNSNQTQWFYKGIKPYVHYVPVQDEDDIFRKIAWAEEHPVEVQAIIRNSTSFVEENLSLEDMYHYYIVLLQEYNKRFKK